MPRRVVPFVRVLAAAGAAALAGCASTGGSDAPAPVAGAGELRTIDAFAPAAARSRVILEIPSFETTPEAIAASADAAIAQAEAVLAQIAAQDPETATFQSTVSALDDAIYPVYTAGSRFYLMKETNPDPAIRRAATEQSTRLEEWRIGLTYREDVYRAIKAFADAFNRGLKGRLEGEDFKLLADTMRDYRRAGLALDPGTRARVEDLQKQLTRLATEFNTNITGASVVVRFSAEELEGVPAAFLEQSRQPDGSHAVRATVITDFLAVMENARREDTRRRLKTARFGAANEANVSVLARMIALRDEIASILGYASWADYQIEPRMARTSARAEAFLRDLQAGLEPKFRDELAEMARLKAADTGSDGATIQLWDFRYYQNRLRKEKYNVDAEALRVYFPFGPTLAGMFDIYERIFGLRFEQIENPAPWAPGVTLHVASDARTGEPLGLFYLDNFPREGKYNHFAQFDIVPGKLLGDGRFMRPVVALVCNFTPPTADGPSLLSHAEVETLFHEFGHALHAMLTRARHAQFAGTNVPRDFVEAPSQMLEAWVWDADTLNRFAADHRDPSRKIDPDVLARMNEARLATAGVFYRRQVALARADLALHAPGREKDPTAVINDTFGEVFLAPPEGTNFGAYWGHLTGYDAGYYGYAWSEAIAADMVTAFERADGRFLSPRVGMRLRNEVYAPGGSREVDESIRRFLGRDPTNEPFLRSIGVAAP